MSNQSNTQTEAQFGILYGNSSTWGKTTKAVFDVLFNGKTRVEAANIQGITTQSIQSYLMVNEAKHNTRISLEQNRTYLKAGK